MWIGFFILSLPISTHKGSPQAHTPGRQEANLTAYNHYSFTSARPSRDHIYHHRFGGNHSIDNTMLIRTRPGCTDQPMHGMQHDASLYHHRRFRRYSSSTVRICQAALESNTGDRRWRCGVSIGERNTYSTVNVHFLARRHAPGLHNGPHSPPSSVSQNLVRNRVAHRRTRTLNKHTTAISA